MWNKLFASMLDSSIWTEPDHVRIVWITILASMDRDGYAHYASPKNLSIRAQIPLDKCEDAIRKLMSPDPDSGDPDNEGRRIERVPGGYIVLNAAKYRDIYSKEVQRENTRLRVAAWRERQKTTPAPVQQPSLAGLEMPPPAPPSPPAAPKPKRDHYHPEARTVLHILNEACGKQFREVDANLSIISQRLEEPGVDLDGVRKMITHRCSLWMDKPDMREYLRPETLFRKSKFDSYYASRDEAIQNGNGHMATLTPDKPARLFELRAVCEAKIEQRNKIRNRGFEDAMGWNPATESDAREHKKLTAEIGELKKRISEFPI